MSLKDYFETNKGVGVLSTADGNGKVDSAIYSRPHLIENGTVAWIMRDRLSHSNLQSNPYASFLFKEDGEGYSGKRLFLTKVGEEQNTERLQSLRRRKSAYNDGEDRFLVFFKVDKELPLVGDGN
ncbi:MAG: pyridoxamine 5'-phosphate oxidase family protein [Desulfobacterales bacterium]|nr:pyridoxamine 5'-phosphate oxidase family protein [Desulfobacterales bacterium]